MELSGDGLEEYEQLVYDTKKVKKMQEKEKKKARGKRRTRKAN